MKIADDGRLFFGFFDGTYREPTDDLRDFENQKNDVPSGRIIAHIETLTEWIASAKAKDVYTGELYNVGYYNDGKFHFSVEVLRYLKAGKIGVPKEYEEYLVKQYGL